MIVPVLDGLRTRTPVLIIGGVGAGKTRTAELIAAELARRGIEVGGVLSPRIMCGGETVGYTVRDLSTGEERRFAGLDPPGIPVGRFFISADGLEFARTAIVHAARNARIVFVDEVGRLELDGAGLANAVRIALRGRALPVLLVRDELLEPVRRAFMISRFIEIKPEGGEICA